MLPIVEMGIASSDIPSPPVGSTKDFRLREERAKDVCRLEQGDFTALNTSCEHNRQDSVSSSHASSMHG